jgi:hypothetical protein
MAYNGKKKFVLKYRAIQIEHGNYLLWLVSLFKRKNIIFKVE